jgi:hypothetical protein
MDATASTVGTQAIAEALEASQEPASSPVATPELASRFDELMKGPDAAPAAGNDTAQSIGGAIESAQTRMRSVDDEALGFADATRGMNPSDIMQASMRLNMKMAIVHTELDMASSAVAGGNKSLQTLLKGQ